MKTICVIQARLGSTRLPGKVLMDICGKPMIQHVIERARAIPGMEAVYLTTPEKDATRIAWAPGVHVDGVFWHMPPDVLTGYYNAAVEKDASVIMRLTGDCPLIAPEVCAAVLDPVLVGTEFSTNDTTSSGWPDGLDCEVFTRDLLDRANSVAAGSDREHVCPWMRRYAQYPVVYRLGFAPAYLKLSVDIQEDLHRVRRIMARIPAGDYSWAATKKAIEEEG